MSFSHSELIYPLDCKFNRQLDLNYDVKPWKEIFPSYHNCHGSMKHDPENSFIIHLNGNSTSFADFKIQSELNEQINL